jgi:hypothetical protein
MGKPQDQLDRERDEAADRLHRAGQSLASARSALTGGERPFQEAVQLEETTAERVLFLEEQKRLAELAMPGQSRKEAIDAARASAAEVDSDEKAAPFTAADEERVGQEFDRALEEARATLSKARALLEDAIGARDRAASKVEEARAQHARLLLEQELAEREELEASIAHAIAAELAQQGLKKRVRFLAWDGTLGTGLCNTRPPDPAGPAAQARVAFTARKTVLTVPTAEGPKVSATLHTPTTVSVRIVSCTAGPFTPAGEARAVVELELKRMFRIESLLFRVVSGATTVYQEVLNAGQLDALPETALEASVPLPIVPLPLGGDPVAHALDEAQRRLRAIPAAGFARPDAGPFRFRVWVSDQPNAFAGIAPATQPVEAYGSLVHDQSLRPARKATQSESDYAAKKAKVERNQPGVNQTQVKKVKLVNFAIHAVLTKHVDATTQTVADKIGELRASLQAANAHFGAARPDEVRILLGPEWYFQKQGLPWTHPPAVKTTILNQLQGLSASADGNGWLLLPGTILYAEPLATSGATAVFNLMPILAAGALVHQYHKRQWGSDTQNDCTARRLHTDPPWYPVGFEERANGNEKRATALDAGRFPASLAAPMRLRWGTTSGLADKAVTGGANPSWTVTSGAQRIAVWKPGKKRLRLCHKELFANAIEDDTSWNDWIGNGLVRANFQQSNFFLHAGLKLAIEICADHGGGRAAGEYQPADGHALPGADGGVDIHLVSSVGVNPVPWKSVARTGGIWAYLNGEAGQCFARPIAARAAPVATVGGLVRNSWATKQAPNTPYAAAVPPPGVPVTLGALTPPATDAGIATLKYVSLLLEEV